MLDMSLRAVRLLLGLSMMFVIICFVLIVWFFSITTFELVVHYYLYVPHIMYIVLVYLLLTRVYPYKDVD
jgi:hypothetical protein